MDTLLMAGDEAIKLGAELIKKGEIVVFPTETVYGLGANAFDSEAISKIYIAKGRPSDNPLIVHVAEKSQIAELTKFISAEAQKVIDKFMPGAITVILPKADKLPSNVTAGLDSVGIRMPIHEVARQFIKACGVPIAAPSANTSSRISPTTAKHVYNDMLGRVPLIIDGGSSDVGIESTIIDMTTDVPTILRPGAITAEMLADELGKVVTFKGQVVVAKAPGMKYKHYAPKCDMITGDEVDKLVNEYDKKIMEGKDPIILASSSWLANCGERKNIDLGDTQEEITHNIYGAMHDAEDIANYIICQDFGTQGMLGSVMNRVNKASAGKKL